MLSVVPVGVLFYNQEAKQIFYNNNELNKIIGNHQSSSASTETEEMLKKYVHTPPLKVESNNQSSNGASNVQQAPDQGLPLLVN